MLKGTVSQESNLLTMLKGTVSQESNLLTMLIHVEVRDLLAALLVVHDDLDGVEVALEVGVVLQLIPTFRQASEKRKEKNISTLPRITFCIRVVFHQVDPFGLRWGKENANYNN
jgi:hypothetical protein